MNIFLTGASSGIGQALAKEFAANGATLGLVARREDKLKELIAELPNPELHTAIVCDVTDRDRLIEEARKFDEACGGVDIAVACAGISVGVKHNTEKTWTSLTKSLIPTYSQWHLLSMRLSIR